MTGRTAYRGQPLLFLSLVLIGWVGVRIMTWQSPITYPASLAGFAKGTVVNQVTAQTGPDVTSPARGQAAKANSLSTRSPAQASANDAKRVVPDAPNMVDDNAVLPQLEASPNRDFWEPAPAPPEPEIAPVPHWQGSMLQPKRVGPAAKPAGALPVPTEIAAGHQILMAAAFSHMELPADTQAAVSQAIAARSAKAVKDAPALATRPKPIAASPTNSAPSASRPNQSSDRWSIDGWLLLRSDDTASLAGLEPSYGRSQAGAVLRYSLDPASSFKPQAYARATGALEGAKELDFATGLSARLGEKIPLRLAAEIRASRQGGAWEARPAMFAVTELPEAKLPFELRGEAYAQAGYVGGDFATAFVDGQARVDRKLAEFGDAELRIGAAGWGGAQKDAARLDIGPTASVSFKLGEGRARLSADYRLRVAGDAQPDSGPAITLTAGF